MSRLFLIIDKLVIGDILPW